MMPPPKYTTPRPGTRCYIVGDCMVRITHPRATWNNRQRISRYRRDQGIWLPVSLRVAGDKGCQPC